MQTINVVANPYFFIGHDGTPQGVVAKPGMRDTWIGADVDHAASIAAGRLRFWYADGVVSLPFTAELARAVQDGCLFAADTESAAMCGISDVEFQTAHDCLVQAELAAAAQWKADTGRAMKPAPVMVVAAAAGAAVAPAASEASDKLATGGSLWTTPAVDSKADLGGAPTTSK